MARSAPLTLIEVRCKDRLAPPAKRPSGLASVTLPVTAAPSGIAVLPSITTELARVPGKLWPAWLILDPTAWPRRTVRAVPAGMMIGSAFALSLLGSALGSACVGCVSAGAVVAGVVLLASVDWSGFLLQARRTR